MDIPYEERGSQAISSLGYSGPCVGSKWNLQL